MDAFTSSTTTQYVQPNIPTPGDSLLPQGTEPSTVSDLKKYCTTCLGCEETSPECANQWRHGTVVCSATSGAAGGTLLSIGFQMARAGCGSGEVICGLFITGGVLCIPFAALMGLIACDNCINKVTQSDTCLR